MTARNAAREQARAIDVAVARRVKARRIEAGKTQQEIADALGIAYQQMHKYESATNRISAGRLAQIAAALDVPVAWFFEERAA